MSNMNSSIIKEDAKSNSSTVKEEAKTNSSTVKEEAKTDKDRKDSNVSNKGGVETKPETKDSNTAVKTAAKPEVDIATLKKPEQNTEQRSESTEPPQEEMEWWFVSVYHAVGRLIEGNYYDDRDHYFYTFLLAIFIGCITYGTKYHVDQVHKLMCFLSLIMFVYLLNGTQRRVSAMFRGTTDRISLARKRDPSVRRLNQSRINIRSSKSTSKKDKSS